MRTNVVRDEDIHGFDIHGNEPMDDFRMDDFVVMFEAIHGNVLVNSAGEPFLIDPPEQPKQKVDWQTHGF